MSWDVDVLTLRSQDRAAYLRATELLKPTGAALEVAAGRYAESVRILGGDNIVEAARFFAKRNPSKLPQKTIREVLDELIASKARAGLGERYLDDLRYRCGKFADAFHCNLSTITGNQIQAFLDSLKLSPQSYVNFCRVLKTLFRFAQRKGYLPKDDDELDRLEKVKVKPSAIEIYTPKEMERLLVAAAKDFLPALAIGAFAGLRSAELERLDWHEVHMQEGFIEVTAAKAKTASRRLVPILDNLACWLAPSIKPAGKVWPYDHDSFYDTQQRTAAAARTDDLPGVAWKPNGLRHSWISYRLAAIQNANQVALEAGNSLSVIYSHYRELVRPADAVRWFGIQPSAQGNFVLMRVQRAGL